MSFTFLLLARHSSCKHASTLASGVSSAFISVASLDFELLEVPNTTAIC